MRFVDELCDELYLGIQMGICWDVSGVGVNVVAG